MTHLPFVVASYGLAALALIGFGAHAWWRMGAARSRLAAIDPRHQREAPQRQRETPQRQREIPQRQREVP